VIFDRKVSLINLGVIVMKKAIFGIFVLVFGVMSGFGNENPTGSIPYGKYKVGDSDQEVV